MPHKTHKIIGKVVDVDTGSPVSDALVEAWDKDLGPDDALGSATTDAQGKFTIKFGLFDYLEARPDVYFGVHLGDEYLGSTEQSILQDLEKGTTEVEITVDAPQIGKVERDIYLKIEVIPDYCPVEPSTDVPAGVQYRRDCMRNTGHESGTIPNAEVQARTLDALIYREYEDADYLVPKTNKLVQADLNEPIFHRRVPGTVIYAKPSELLRIHVWNCDTVPHTFHVHGVEYGVDSDGAWPFGVASPDGRRSDEICPGETWAYTFCATEETVGVWPFHDHWRMAGPSIERGLFGGLVVLPKEKVKPTVHVIPRVKDFLDLIRKKMKPLPVPAPPRPIDPEFRRRVDEEIEFLKENLKDFVIRPFPPRAKVLHVPLFFHVMKNPFSRPLFDTGDIHELGGTAQLIFDTAGTFEYLCTVHPMMEGTVEVVPGAPTLATVQIQDADPAAGLPMGFYPQTVQVAPGGTVQWTNTSKFHHTATSKQGVALPTHCFNGRGFVGNSPTIVGNTGQTIRWYVFNLDLGLTWHNFHPHNQRWKFGGQTMDVRSLGPAESFMVETKVPPVLLLTDEIKAIQNPVDRPPDAQKYTLKGDFLFHCHVHHHMMAGMVGLVRAKQTIWLTAAMKAEIESRFTLAIDDGSNACPDVDLERCAKKEVGTLEQIVATPPVIQMHAALLPNTDKVVMWGHDAVDQTRIFDATTETFSPPALQPAAIPGENQSTSNLWSAGHAYLDTPEGHLMAHGALTGPPRIRSYLFNPATMKWCRTGDTNHGRFYPTTITLADGKLLTLYGTGGPDSWRLEIFDPAAGAADPPNEICAGQWTEGRRFSNDFNFFYYPWTYLLPDGEIFIAGPTQRTHKVDWTGTAADPDLAQVVGKYWDTNAGDRGSNMKGTSVMLALRPPGYAVRVLIAGGSGIAANQSVEMIDLSAPSPAWVEDPKWRLKEGRIECTSVLLPNGKVFIAGGINPPSGGGHIEVFDPQNPDAGWRLGPELSYARRYHSSSILLRDGSVLIGGDEYGIDPCERWYPDYYYLSRPAISNAPASVAWGAAFTIDTPNAPTIGEVVLLRPGAVTHGFDQSQRLVELAISAVGAGSVNVHAPPNANVAPPGHYLVFILNGSRVPSVGRWIRLTT